MRITINIIMIITMSQYDNVDTNDNNYNQKMRILSGRILPGVRNILKSFFFLENLYIMRRIAVAKFDAFQNSKLRLLFA